MEAGNPSVPPDDDDGGGGAAAAVPGKDNDDEQSLADLLVKLYKDINRGVDRKYKIVDANGPFSLIAAHTILKVYMGDRKSWNCTDSIKLVGYGDKIVEKDDLEYELEKLEKKLLDRFKKRVWGKSTNEPNEKKRRPEDYDSDSSEDDDERAKKKNKVENRIVLFEGLKRPEWKGRMKNLPWFQGVENASQWAENNGAYSLLLPFAVQSVVGLGHAEEIKKIIRATGRVVVHPVTLEMILVCFDNEFTKYIRMKRKVKDPNAPCPIDGIRLPPPRDDYDMSALDIHIRNMRLRGMGKRYNVSFQMLFDLELIAEKKMQKMEKDVLDYEAAVGKTLFPKLDEKNAARAMKRLVDPYKAFFDACPTDLMVFQSQESSKAVDTGLGHRFLEADYEEHIGMLLCCVETLESRGFVCDHTDYEFLVDVKKGVSKKRFTSSFKVLQEFGEYRTKLVEKRDLLKKRVSMLYYLQQFTSSFKKGHVGIMYNWIKKKEKDGQNVEFTRTTAAYEKDDFQPTGIVVVGSQEQEGVSFEKTKENGKLQAVVQTVVAVATEAQPAAAVLESVVGELGHSGMRQDLVAGVAEAPVPKKNPSLSPKDAVAEGTGSAKAIAFR